MNSNWQQDNRPIGIFDSGVGGLTVYKEIRGSLPAENLIYFGDTARVPYGGKSYEVINRYSEQIAAFLVEKNIKLLVVACNTACALALSNLKKQLSVPVIGVIDPGVRAAIGAASRNNKIGVIGTKATIGSKAYQNKILRLRNDYNVYATACPLFVPIVEENLTSTTIAKEAVSMYLEYFKDKEIDSLILACTHYPLLKPLISDFFNNDVVLIDSAQETAREVSQLLKALRILHQSAQMGDNQFYVSDSPQSFAAIAESFLPFSISDSCFFHDWQSK